MTIAKFKTRYSAKKEASKMVGWNTKIFREDANDGTFYYIIQCNGTKYLMNDGFVR